MRYVVIEQRKSDNGINDVIGPFNEWELASAYASHMQANGIQSFSYVIREIHSTHTMKMSK